MKYLSAMLLFFFLYTSTAQAQQSNQSPKDPTTATLISVVLTGGGHFYAGDNKTGAILLGIGVGAPLIGASASNIENFTPLYLGLAASLGAWVYGIATSADAAREYNNLHNLTYNNITLEPAEIALNNALIDKNSSYGVKLSVKF